MKRISALFVRGLILVSCVCLGVLASAEFAAADDAAADKAWQEVLAAAQAPPQPADWTGKLPSDDELARYFVPFEIKGADKARDFYTRFPGHPAADQARQQEFEMLQVAVQRFGDSTQKARFVQLQKERGYHPEEDAQFAFRLQEIEHGALVKSQEVYRAEKDRAARALQKEFPRRPEVYELLWRSHQGMENEAARADAREIATNEFASPETRAAVKAALARFELLGRPVSIQFTALNGLEVDTAGMLGKVVLVDFWATWCGPCVAEMPRLLETHEKFHSRGLEIIGISFDTQKDQLAAFVKERRMDWPQFFESAGAENRFGKRFGIVGIPKLWLIDKHGNLRDFDARTNLEEKVAKLIEE